MARQPYFSGNYGSALAQVDTRPIMQGAAAQAAMYQGLGQNIGGAIEKYQLNKEKREKEESTAMGTLAGMSLEEKSQFIQGNPKLEKAVESALSDTAKPADFSMINSGTAPFLAGKTRALERGLKETQAESAALTLRMAKALEETTVQLQKDKGTISSLSAAIAKETNPQRLELLQGQLASAVADLGENPAKRAESRALLKDSAAKRVKLGGSEGVGDFAARKTKAAVEQAEASVGLTVQQGGYYKSKGETDKITALAKAENDKITAYAKLNPGFKAKLEALDSVKKSLLSDTVETPQGERVTFKKYKELHHADAKKYPMTGIAAKLDGLLKTYDKKMETLYQEEKVQVVDPEAGGTGGGAGAPLPSVIDPSKMTPDQARTATSQRIDEIHARVNVLNEELDGLGDPGATMPAPVSSAALWGGYGGAPTYSSPQPATVQYNNRKEQQITTDIAALKEELNQLYALKF